MARLLARALVFAAFLFVLPAQPALAGTTTGCGTVLVAGTAWLEGKGVDVRSNGVGWAGSCAGGSAGYGYQCVDLAYRLYQKMGWGRVRAGGNGGAAYLPAGSSGLTFHANGTYMPVPGDLIIEGATKSNAYGHVAVVDSVQGATIHGVEQNTQYQTTKGWVDHPRHDYHIASLHITGGYGAVSGVLHSPKNTLTNAAVPVAAATSKPTPAPTATPAPAAAGIVNALLKAAEEAAAKAAAASAAAAAAQAGATFHTTSSTNVRAGAGTEYRITGTLAAGRSITVVCQALGTSVGGSRIWDELSSGGWVTDYYVSTPRFNAFTPGIRRC